MLELGLDIKCFLKYILSLSFSTSCFNPYPANVENMVSSYNASRYNVEFNSAFKELNYRICELSLLDNVHRNVLTFFFKYIF